MSVNYLISLLQTLLSSTSFSCLRKYLATESLLGKEHQIFNCPQAKNASSVMYIFCMPFSEISWPIHMACDLS